VIYLLLEKVIGCSQMPVYCLRASSWWFYDNSMALFSVLLSQFQSRLWVDGWVFVNWS